MKTLWKEYGQTVITVLVAALLLILCLWGFRIIGSGMERPAAGADVGNNMDGRMLQCFIVPWMNPADINRTPKWVNDTVWYQIFPDRFCNGTPERNTAEIVP